MWPALFAAVGAPSALLEGLLGAGALASAACCLLIVDRIEGPAPAHALALRLIRARRPARPCRRDVCIACRTPLHTPQLPVCDPLLAWDVSLSWSHLPPLAGDGRLGAHAHARAPARLVAGCARARESRHLRRRLVGPARRCVVRAAAKFSPKCRRISLTS